MVPNSGNQVVLIPGHRVGPNGGNSALNEALRYCKMTNVSGAMSDADKLEQFMIRELYTKKIYHMPERTIRQYAPQSVRKKETFEAAADILEVHNRAKRLTVNGQKIVCLSPFVVHEYHK